MEFRLIYQGPLPPEGRRGGGRTAEKQHLRKCFHLQLVELWRRHPSLREQSTKTFIKITTPPNLISAPGPNVEQVFKADYPGGKPWTEHIADDHEEFGFRFVPLISKKGGFSCSLNILFLRREDPGNLVTGGDIDNRIKVLLDGLKKPSSEQEMTGWSPEPHETPFFCLLEDDNLITGLSVTTDRLLTAMESSESENDVWLIIHVIVSDESALFASGRLI